MSMILVLLFFKSLVTGVFSPYTCDRADEYVFGMNCYLDTGTSGNLLDCANTCDSWNRGATVLIFNSEEERAWWAGGTGPPPSSDHLLGTTKLSKNGNCGSGCPCDTACVNEFVNIDGSDTTFMDEWEQTHAHSCDCDGSEADSGFTLTNPNTIKDESPTTGRKCDCKWRGVIENLSTSCYGIPSTDGSVCEGHGNCAALDTCVCEFGRQGKTCGYQPSWQDCALKYDHFCYKSSGGTSQTFSEAVSECANLGDGLFTLASIHSPYAFYRVEEYLNSIDSWVGLERDLAGELPPSAELTWTDGSEAKMVNVHTERLIKMSSGDGSSTHFRLRAGNSEFQGRNDDSGYSALCSYEVPKCFGVYSDSNEVCSGFGECDTKGSGACTCISSDYWGLNCNITRCHGILSYEENVCSGHGECTAINYCSNCDEHYTGEFCNVTTCGGTVNTNPDVCSGHGLCKNYDQCNCFPTWAGVTDCYTSCFGVWENDTARVCSGHGNCEFLDSCKCSEYYFGDECTDWKCDNIFNNQSSSVCSGGNGECVDIDECRCDPNYFGQFCEVTICDEILSNSSLRCNGWGDCWPYEKCTCTNSDYFGFYCNETTCDGIESNDNAVCSGHGNCWPKDICICSQFYDAPQFYCNVTSCFGISSQEEDSVCSGNGVCWPYDVCQCNDHYYSSECEVDECYEVLSNESSVCSGHGDCSSFNNCSCQSGYAGDECELWECFGAKNTDLFVCSEHGECQDVNNCSCLENYWGEECDLWSCMEISRDRYWTCTGHGECVDHNVCNCTDGYPGEFCNKWNCYGLDYNDKKSCGSRGVCIDFDMCLCSQGYNSTECQDFYCGEIHYTKKKVCSGIGTCFYPDFCLCEEGYSGPICEFFYCGKYLFDDPEVCNKRGTCEAPNTCECEKGFEGDLCQTNSADKVLVPTLIVVASAISLVVFACVVIVPIGLLVLARILKKQRDKLRKFDKLKDVDVLLAEQEMMEDDNIAHIKVDTSLFKIEFKDLELKKLIGEGGSSSSVFLGLWNSKEVAFKCFRTSTINDQKTFSEFESEVNILSSVSHPHLVRFFGACLQPPRVGIVMEYCSRGDLRSFLLKNKETTGNKFSSREKLRWFSEISDCLGYLHDRSVIHRDVKDENVLLDEKLSTKVMDFGLSKVVTKKNSVLTTQIGTSCFKAPEIIAGKKYNNSVDVFSLSILFFVVWSEDFCPFDKETFSEMKVVQDENYRPDLEKLGTCPQWFCDMIKKNWSADPKERMSAKEICELLTEKRNEIKQGPQYQQRVTRNEIELIGGLVRSNLGDEKYLNDRLVEISKLKKRIEFLETLNQV